MVQTFSSAPDRQRIFDALSQLKLKIEEDPGKKGFQIPFQPSVNRFIIFSDQHKGRKNGADDFMNSEATYINALEYYNHENFHLIALGDSEELWENTLLQVRKHNAPSFDAEGHFAKRQMFTKIFGNHDLDWEIDPLAPAILKDLYKSPVIALEAVILQTSIGEKVLRIFCTHGHQGDRQSDGNWFSKWFVAKIWAPLQSYLQINPNTPSTDTELKSLHNEIMYQWSAQQKDLILITGHTHQPVFESLTHAERLQRKKQQALRELNAEWADALQAEIDWGGDRKISFNYLNMKPTYFNSGCCCYADGDITGIEIADGMIRLVKWKKREASTHREILEELKLETLLGTLTNSPGV